MKTKKEVLKANGWEVFEGYCFPSPSADNEMLTFVEKDEALKVFSMGAKIYYWNEYKERLHDEEDAWDTFYDEWTDKNLTDDQDLSFEDWEKEMLK